MMRTSELLEVMVLDQGKAHVWVQKHAVRRDVFVTQNSRWQIKAHLMPTNAYLKLNPAMLVTAGFKPRFLPLLGPYGSG